MFLTSFEAYSVFSVLSILVYYGVWCNCKIYQELSFLSISPNQESF